MLSRTRRQRAGAQLAVAARGAHRALENRPGAGDVDDVGLEQQAAGTCARVALVGRDLVDLAVLQLEHRGATVARVGEEPALGQDRGRGDRRG